MPSAHCGGVFVLHFGEIMPVSVYPTQLAVAAEKLKHITSRFCRDQDTKTKEVELLLLYVNCQ